MAAAASKVGCSNSGVKVKMVDYSRLKDFR